MIKITELDLPGVKIIEPDYFEDNRGYSTESLNKNVLSQNGIKADFVLDYQCMNLKKDTVRGIHFQNNPHSQTKLVRVLQGEIFDIVVDLRKDSPSFKKWIGQIISDKNHKQIYIPNGYGHAFITRSDDTIVLYKFDDYYDLSLARAIRWNDPEIGIQWGIENPILSPGDQNAPFLKDSDLNLTMELNNIWN